MTDRVALDLMGGDAAPDAVLDGALLVADDVGNVIWRVSAPTQTAQR